MTDETRANSGLGFGPTAYQIVYARVTDPERLGAYAAAAERLFATHGARMIARGAATPIEGAWPWHGAVIFAWPSRETVRQVWRSDEYADVRKLREGAAEFQSILVEETLPTAGGPLP